jgi:hypothetical protein
LTAEPGQPPFRGLPDPVGQARFLADTGEAQDVLLVFLVEHVHRVVDGDDPDQPPVLVHHRGRDQVILVEGIGHVSSSSWVAGMVRKLSSVISVSAVLRGSST